MASFRRPATVALQNALCDAHVVFNERIVVMVDSTEAFPVLFIACILGS